MRKSRGAPPELGVTRHLVVMGLCFGLLIPCLLFGQVDEMNRKGSDSLEKGSTFASSIPIAEYIGPLAPVALSPFFGITMLSGASFLVDAGLLPDNAFLQGSKTLNNPLVFLSFLGLTVFTSLPKFTKVTKPMAQAIDQLEAYAGIATIAVMQGISTIQFGGGGEEQVVMQAGIVSMTASTLLMVVSAVNIFVINTIKFLFEVLIWLSPVPAIDALFESALKVICSGLMALYIFSPTLATLLNFIIFFFCLLLFKWAMRMTNYYRIVLFGPILKGMLRGIGLGKEPTATSTRLPKDLRAAYPEPQVVLPVYPGKKLDGFPKRVRSFWIKTKDGNHLIARNKPFGGYVTMEVVPEMGEVKVVRGFIAHSIRIDQGGVAAFKYNFSRSYNPCFGELVDKMGADFTGEAPEGDSSFKEMSRRMGEAARESDVRGEYA